MSYSTNTQNLRDDCPASCQMQGCILIAPYNLLLESRHESKSRVFYNIVSPASYLAFTQLSTLEAETGAEIVYRPFFPPGLFQTTGNASPITIPAKRVWMFDDFGRFARQYDVPFVINTHFPFSSLIMMRGLIAYQETSMLRSLTKTFFEAM